MKVLLLLLVAGLGWAEEPKSVVNKAGAGVMGWFKNLREGLRESAVASRRQKTRVTAVAAVRGSAQGDERADLDSPTMSEPAKARKARQAKKERDALDKAAMLAEEGKLDESLKAFEEFEKNYPKSQLVEQAREAQAKLKEAKAAMAAEPAPEAAPQPAPGPASETAPQ